MPVTSLINPRRLETLPYTPGFWGWAHPFPHETIPTTTPSATSGLPESPCNVLTSVKQSDFYWNYCAYVTSIFSSFFQKACANHPIGYLILTISSPTIFLAYYWNFDCLKLRYETVIGISPTSNYWRCTRSNYLVQLRESDGTNGGIKT